MNPQIFREYDIRGVVDVDLTDPVVQDLGRGAGSYLKKLGINKISLGRDCRLSSDRFRDDILIGLLETGMEVVDLGVVPTPLLYFSIVELDRQGGIMITGSHNPPEYNGFKICIGKETIYGEEIQKVRQSIESRNFEKGSGNVIQKDIRDAYWHYMKGQFKFPRSLKIVIDAGNGTGGVIAVPLMRDLGCEVIELYTEMDGHFPNHHPDPTKEEYLQDLIKTVLEEKAEVGFAYDGDADRIGVIDDLGQIIWGDKLMILFSRQILKEKPGATFVAEVKCSKTLFDDIQVHGGKAVMWKAGHSLMKAKLKEINGILGGEMSGHFFFKDRFFGFDDAIYASGRVLEILAASDMKLSDILADVPKTYVTEEIRIDCPDETKFEIVEKIRAEFKNDYQTIDVDGVRVIFPDGWGLLRASNTQPALVSRFEADTPEKLRQIQDLMDRKLKNYL